ncbi:MAG: hypothetical protein U0804_05155 [Gemmataceae bacterium]
MTDPRTDDIAALLDGFRAALRQRTADARAACEAAAARGERPPTDERAVAETHGDGLVALLDGPTKDALLRRGVFRQLLAGEPAEFAAADFEFADVNSARLADPKAQRYVAKLKTNLQGERAAAAALLNAARPVPEPVVTHDDVFSELPATPAVEPAPAPAIVDARLGALAVMLGRLPTPAPDEVVRFLVAAHTTGADLELLTPGVQEWLRAHGATTGLRVRAG